MSNPLAIDQAVGGAEFAFFRDLVHARSGIALKESKRSLVAARLGQRLRALGLSSFAEYRRLLQTADPSGSELVLMINCMTTNKTSFFREEKHFPILKDSILTAEREQQRVYRVWSAACSTGEEPYSIAMTALGAARTTEVAILASDLDTEVLAKAQQAIYPMESLDEMDDRARRRYFLRGRGESQSWVQVKPAVRQLVTFRHINLVGEPWPIQTHFDAIFCRNVMIYFDRETQTRLFGKLVQYLAPNGLLFVGEAETLYWLDELLVPIDHSVYRVRHSATIGKTP